MQFKNYNTYFALVKDFNARTGVIRDFVEPDDELLHNLNIDSIDEVNDFLHECKKK